MLFSDLNGDGRLDIITADSNSSVVSVLLASADGSFLPQTSHGLSGNTADINVADANADGKLDIVTVSGASGASLLLGAGDGSFVPERVLSAVRTDRMAMADIDHDGQIDSVMVEESTNVLSIRHSAPQVDLNSRCPFHRIGFCCVTSTQTAIWTSLLRKVFTRAMATGRSRR